MKYKLFIDDERYPAQVDWVDLNRWPDEEFGEWVICRTYAEVKSFIDSNGWPTVIAFDHDLGASGETMSGLDIVKSFCESHMDGETVPTFHWVIHSWNNIGRLNMDHYLRNFWKHTGADPALCPLPRLHPYALRF